MISGIYRRLWFVGFMLLLCSRVVAQEVTPTPTPTPEPDPIFSGAVIPNSVVWASNSQSISFDIVGTPTEHYVYELITAEMTRLALPPFMRQLAPEDQEHFRAWNTPVMMSPDGDYFVYESQFDTFDRFEEDDYVHLLAVGSMYSQTFLPMHQTASREFRVRWSDDGSAFVLEKDDPYSGVTSVIYVRSRPNCDQPFCRFDERYVTDLDPGISVFDISPDGLRLLFRGYYGVMIWDATVNGEAQYGEADGTFIDDLGFIIGGAFIPDDTDYVLLVNEEGILIYELSTALYSVINPAINSDMATHVWFSPDYHHVAYLSSENGLYVVSII